LTLYGQRPDAGQGFAVDASMIKADARRQRSRQGEIGIDWGNAEQGSRPVREYLAALDQANPVPPSPKRVSLTDPAATWTAAAGRLLSPFHRIT